MYALCMACTCYMCMRMYPDEQMVTCAIHKPQAPGGFKVCGYYSKQKAIHEGRHSYMLAISGASRKCGNWCLLTPGP